ncbi:NAD-dependent epimerase/dehydratase family protein [Laspinema palackyanum]|uniref:NAD-dependent epimerase/dehydratase family protein n=1 Tax=Laspinema palackyanum TaxID=3231601 RepID=UPI00345C8A46|nr:SDR family oxidoreductase [Laspinema sp. D2c]
MRNCVLITGGFGYLGGRIAVKLAQLPNYLVRLGSRRGHSPPVWLPQAETIAMDVVDPSSLAEAMIGVNAVVHLAAMNEHECIADPQKAILVNTLGTLNVLQAALAANVERFIYFSTAHVYGSPLAGHITEDIIPRPIHPYAITHHAAEDFVLAAHQKQEIIGIVVRLSNAFGTPIHLNVDRWTLLVNDLCSQAIQKKCLTLHSSGYQSRDFIALENVAFAVHHCLQLPIENIGDGLFNLGSGKSRTILEMAQLIANLCSEYLGFFPKIKRPEFLFKEEFKNNTLFFDSTKFFNTNFKASSYDKEEILNTLSLVSSTYN